MESKDSGDSFYRFGDARRRTPGSNAYREYIGGLPVESPRRVASVKRDEHGREEVAAELEDGSDEISPLLQSDTVITPGKAKNNSVEFLLTLGCAYCVAILMCVIWLLW